MNRQHADAELSGFANCGSDGGGDVMIFQIEKDTPAWSHQFAHDLRAFGGVELHADFISGSGVAHGRHNPATIFLAATAEDTSRATIRCCRASLIGRACIRRSSIRRSFISRPRIKGSLKDLRLRGYG